MLKYIVLCYTGDPISEIDFRMFSHLADAEAYLQTIDASREPTLYCVMPTPDRGGDAPA